MGIKCLILCSDKYGPLSNVTLHRFPKDSERFYKWVKICRRPDLVEKSPNFCYHTYRLCSEHFVKTDFNNNCWLNNNAVPSVFNWSDVKLKETRSLGMIPEESIPSISVIMANSVDINSQSIGQTYLPCLVQLLKPALYPKK